MQEKTKTIITNDKTYTVYAKPIGQGAFGTVYQTTDGKYAIKEVFDKQEKKKRRSSNTPKQEAELLRQKSFLRGVLFGVNPSNKRQKYIVTEFRSEFDMGDGVELNAEFQHLTGIERLRVFRAVVESAHHLHHQTLSGEACIHNDLKLSNIKIGLNKNKDNKLVSASAFLMDFGQTILAHNPDKVDYVGTTWYTAPERFGYTQESKEVVHPVQSIAGDLYAFGILFAFLFGKNIVAQRKQALRKAGVMPEWGGGKGGFMPMPEFFEGAYDLKELFEHHPLPKVKINNKLINIQQYVLAFIQKMLDFDDKKRPDPDEILLFFTAIDNLYKVQDELKSNKNLSLSEKQAYKNDLCIYHAKLVVLSSGLWNEKIGERKIECFTRIDELGSEVVSKKEPKVGSATFAQFDFNENLDFCRKLTEPDNKTDILSTAKESYKLINDAKEKLLTSDLWNHKFKILGQTRKFSEFDFGANLEFCKLVLEYYTTKEVILKKAENIFKKEADKSEKEVKKETGEKSIPEIVEETRKKLWNEKTIWNHNFKIFGEDRFIFEVNFEANLEFCEFVLQGNTTEAVILDKATNILTGQAIQAIKEKALKAIQGYQTEKKQEIKNSYFSGITAFFSPTAAKNKIRAAELLIATFNDFDNQKQNFYASKNESLIKALRHGELGKLAKPLMEYLDKSVTEKPDNKYDQYALIR